MLHLENIKLTTNNTNIWNIYGIKLIVNTFIFIFIFL